jgi:chromate transporter
MADFEQTYTSTPDAAKRGSLRELALFFLRLGVTAFGGPAAHIAIMEDELVRRRKWLSREKFLDLLGASSLIPGPSSSELAIHIGYLRAGWAGLVVGGMCFIFPAALLVGMIAWAYVHFGHLPAVAALLYGVKPVAIAVILQALWGLGRTAVKVGCWRLRD